MITSPLLPEMRQARRTARSGTARPAPTAAAAARRFQHRSAALSPTWQGLSGIGNKGCNGVISVVILHCSLRSVALCAMTRFHDRRAAFPVFCMSGLTYVRQCKASAQEQVTPLHMNEKRPSWHVSLSEWRRTSCQHSHSPTRAGTRHESQINSQSSRGQAHVIRWCTPPCQARIVNCRAAHVVW